jgi:CHAT domain-containing protein
MMNYQINRLVKQSLYWLIIIQLPSLSIAQPEISDLNQQIEELSTDLSYCTSHNMHPQIDVLLKACEGIDYLDGAITLIQEKIEEAVTVGNSTLIDEMEDNYSHLAVQAVSYGMSDKWFFYKFLHLVIRDYTDGYQSIREEIQSLVERNDIVISNENRLVALIYIWENAVGDNSKSEYKIKIDEFSSQYKIAINTPAYANYCSQMGFSNLNDGNFEAALDYFSQSKLILGEVGLKHGIDSREMVCMSTICLYFSMEEDEELLRKTVGIIDQILDDKYGLLLSPDLSNTIIRFSHEMIDHEMYDEAISMLKRCVESWEIIFVDLEDCLRATVEHPYTRDKYGVHLTFEQFQVAYPLMLTQKIADHMKEVGDNLGRVESLLSLLDYNIKYGNIRNAGEICLQLSFLYADAGEWKSSEEYIRKAENFLQLLQGEEYMTLAFGISYVLLESVNLSDNKHYLRKIDNFINKSLEIAKDLSNHQFEYDLSIMLARAYSSAEQDREKQYELLCFADSIANSANLEKHHDMNGTYIDLLVWDHNDYEAARRIIKEDFEYYFNEADYVSAYFNGLSFHKTYILGRTLEQQDYQTLVQWIDKLRNKVTEQEFLLMLQLDEMHAELTLHYSRDDYKAGLRLIPEYVKIKDSAIDTKIQTVIDNYINLGKTLLNHSSFAADTLMVNMLMPVVEPLQWEYGNDLPGDTWFLQFVDGEKADFNEVLYLKYINRILSYPLDKQRLEEKLYHANRLTNLFGNHSLSLELYEEGLLEAKELGDLKLELLILSELAHKYVYNRQFNLGRRRYVEAYNLAKTLKDDENLLIILSNILDNNLFEKKSQLHSYAQEYYDLGKKLEDYTAQIQSLGHIIEYYQLVNMPDSLESFMVKGFTIRDSVILHVSELRYLHFVQKCYKILNSDGSGQLSEPIKDYVFNGIPISDNKIHQLYQELVYLKDFNYRSIPIELSSQYPFVYYQTNASAIQLKEFWDDEYLQAEEFNENLQRLLNLSNQHEHWGKINALWIVEERIEKIGEWPGAEKYYGFGFRYNFLDRINGIEVTSVNRRTSAHGIFYPNDIILCDPDVLLSPEDAKGYLVAKAGEANHDINQPSSFTVLRNDSDTLIIHIMPDFIQPNPYSNNPSNELSELIDIFFEESDKLIKTTKNIRSYGGFASTYRDFLIDYPAWYTFINKIYPPQEEMLKTLERYEKISTYGLLSETMRHKENLERNPLLVSEYKKYSNKISEIQKEMQKEHLSESDLSKMNTDRAKAFSQLDYFENFILEKNEQREQEPTFSFKENQSTFNSFDKIVRFCASDFSNNGFFEWSNQTGEWNYTILKTEQEINAQIKVSKNLIMYTAEKNTLSKLETDLVNLSETIFNTPIILPDEMKTKVNSWLIIPEQSTYMIPFELLQFRFQSDTTNYHYLGEYVNISYAPSLTSFVQFAQKISNTNKLNSALLVSANPNIQSTTNYVSNLFALRSDYGSLDYVDDEVADIKKTLLKSKLFQKKYEVKSFNSKNISEGSFKSEPLIDYKYIHIAAHGVIDNDDPQYSGLLLGSGEHDQNDGILQAHEIFPRNIDADIVTLSSCFSGFGEIDHNEGNLGIYRSFMIAGARSVIISLWNVEDESTSILFSKFYEFLKNGNSKAESLRLAKIYLKNETKFSHPFYWAPFILMGES